MRGTFIEHRVNVAVPVVPRDAVDHRNPRAVPEPEDDPLLRGDDRTLEELPARLPANLRPDGMQCFPDETPAELSLFSGQES